MYRSEIAKIQTVVTSALLLLGTHLAEASTHMANINGKTVKVYNTTPCSDANVDQLVTKADIDMGGIIDSNDRVFVRKRYMIWLDNTGFFGMMNGVWRLRLTGSPITCDFRHKLANGRAPNSLLPGEDGNGFAGKLARGMHWEIADTPKTLDGPENFVYSSTNDWVKITPPNGHWCNPTQPRYQINEPVLDHANPGTLNTFQWIQPLTIEAKPPGSSAVCHSRDLIDFNDANGVRAAVDLRIIYNLGIGNGPKIAMGAALINNGPEPITLSIYGLIGGFVPAKVTTEVPWKQYWYNYFVGMLVPDRLNHTFPDRQWVFHPRTNQQGQIDTDYSLVHPVYRNKVAAWSDPQANRNGVGRLWWYAAGTTNEANSGWTRDKYYEVFLAEGSLFPGGDVSGRTLAPGEATATTWRVIRFD